MGVFQVFKIVQMAPNAQRITVLTSINTAERERERERGMLLNNG